MGINGLLPFLEKSSRRANIKEFSGQTVAIDAYCWLHKGAFSCAEKLVMKEPTTMYVTYCMKFVNMLLSHNIKPILVFDGRYLPAKSMTEKKRRENREVNRRKGADLLRAGRVEEGRNYLRRSVDITHELALNLIRECRKRNVDCIVAPFEADAQLAYFSLKNIAQVIVTEDSDLLLFGCARVMFKMDVNGNGILIEKDRLYVAMGVRSDLFSIDKFRYMCILSGCDYLASLPGIGLNKACKFVNRTSEANISEALRKLPVNLNMKTLIVTDEYRKNFLDADKTFKYQLVYDPILRQQVPLNEVEDENEVVGLPLDDDTAFQLAIGNYDPMSLKKLDDYDPDGPKPKLHRLDQAMVAPHASIWSSNYVPKQPKPQNSMNVLRLSTAGICVKAQVFSPLKRPNEVEVAKAAEKTKSELLHFYGGGSKRLCQSQENLESVDEKISSPSDPLKSPNLNKKNPFAIKSRLKNFKRNSLRGLAKFTLANEENDLLSSRYFSSNNSLNLTKSNSTALDLLNESDSSLNLTATSCTQVTEESSNLSSEELSNEIINSDNSNIINISENCIKGSTDNLEISSTKLKLEKFSLNDSNKWESSVESESDLNKFSQEENCSYMSNLSVINDKSNLVQNVNEAPKSDQYSPKFLPKMATKMKAFYETETIDEIDTVGRPTSLFFDTVDKSQNQFFKFNKSPVISPKKSSKVTLKTGLSRPKIKASKQQSLLSSFGFTPRPKFMSEKK